MPWAMRPLNAVVAANSSLMWMALMSPDTPANITMSASVMVLEKVAFIPTRRSSMSYPFWSFMVLSLCYELVRGGTLHPRVVRSTAAFGRDPHDVLGRVLDVAGLAMHAVLRVDLQAVAVVFVLDELIDPGRAVARLGSCIPGQVDGHRHAGIFQGQM